MKTSNRFIAVLSFVLSSSALAATSASMGGSSSASSSSLGAALKKNFKASYYGYFYGPSLGGEKPMSSHQPAADGSVGDTLELYNSVTLGYMIAPNYKAYINPRFSYLPADGGTTIGTGSNVTTGAKLLMLNPRVGLTRSNLIQSGNFSLTGQVAAELPGSLSSREQNLVVAPHLAATPAYNIPGTRIETAADFLVRSYIYNSGGTVTGARRAWYGYFSPYAAYRFAPSFAAKLLYEAEAQNNETKSVWNWDSMGTNLQPRVSWDITRNLNIEPYVKVFPANRLLSASATAIGVEINGTLY